MTVPRKPPETLDCRRTVLLASLRRLRLPLSRSLRSRDSRGSLRALRSNHERCSAYVAGVRRPLRPLPFPPCYCDRYSMWTVGELLWLVIAPPCFRDVYGVKAFRLATFSGTGQLYPTSLRSATLRYNSTAVQSLLTITASLTCSLTLVCLVLPVPSLARAANMVSVLHRRTAI